jgi:hypothetical protein
MSDSFKDKFTEIGGLWRTKSGKGLSGKIKVAIPADTSIFIFDNKSDNPKAPIHKMFIEKKGQPEPRPDDEGAPF